jgi:hypothetical protein
MSNPQTVDERDAQWMLEACEFSACCWLKGRVQKVEGLASIFDAGASALILEAQAEQGRQGMAYAITPAGRSTLIPRPIWLAAVERITAMSEADARAELTRQRKATRARQPAATVSPAELLALVEGRKP